MSNVRPDPKTFRDPKTFLFILKQWTIGFVLGFACVCGTPAHGEAIQKEKIGITAEAGGFYTSNSLGNMTMTDEQKEAGQESPADEKKLNAKEYEGNETQEATNKSPTPNEEAISSFTADEIWAKMLKVIELPDGQITKEKVENIFGVKLMFDEVYLKNTNDRLYKFKTKFMYISYINDANSATSFSFKWRIQE